jgi:hypothetical protein
VPNPPELPPMSRLVGCTNFPLCYYLLTDLPDLAQSMPDYLSQVASVTGLARQRPDSAFFSKGIVVGLKDGYIVAINPKPPFRGPDERSAIQIMVRTGGIKAPDQVRSTLQHHFLWGPKVTIDTDSVSHVWHYSFARPSPQKIGHLVREVLAALNPVADRCTKCDKCGATQTLDIFLLGPYPKMLCSRCRQQLVDEATALEDHYAKLPVHFGRAVLLASISSISGAEIVARGWHDSSKVYPFFWSTAVLGFVIGFITAIGAGKITPGVKALAYSATTLGVWIAFIRSLALNDPAHPVQSGWDPGPLLLAGLVALWCTWLPLLLASLGMFVWRVSLAYRVAESEGSRAAGGGMP